MIKFRYLTVQPEHWPHLGKTLPELLSGDWSADALRGMQAAGHQLRMLASDSTPVAFAEFQWVVDECQLFNIAVLKESQRQGLGLLLLKSLLQESSEQQMKTCVLEVRESNLAARRLYQKAGFTVSGRRPNYYPAVPPVDGREAAVLYSCGLSSEAGD